MGHLREVGVSKVQDSSSDLVGVVTSSHDGEMKLWVEECCQLGVLDGKNHGGESGRRVCIIAWEDRIDFHRGWQYDSPSGDQKSGDLQTQHIN